MTVSQRWPLQQAVHAKLTSALLGEGLGGANVPVFDHVPNDPPRLHVRIDGFGVIPGPSHNGRRARHMFMVHVFDENTGADTGTGTIEIARLQAVIVAALDEWPPFEGATGIEHISSNSADDNDPLTQHGVSRFSTQIGV